MKPYKVCCALAVTEVKFAQPARDKPAADQNHRDEEVVAN
jgi:hypothetical protein